MKKTDTFFTYIIVLLGSKLKKDINFTMKRKRKQQQHTVSVDLKRYIYLNCMYLNLLF